MESLLLTFSITMKRVDKRKFKSNLGYYKNKYKYKK